MSDFRYPEHSLLRAAADPYISVRTAAYQRIARTTNDYTPLHYAACIEDISAMELLLAHGADLNTRTRIDDYATPLEEMEILGREQSVAFLTKALGKST